MRVPWMPDPIVDVHVSDPPLPARMASPSGEAAAGRPPLAERMAGLVADMDRAGVASSLVVLAGEAEEFIQVAPRHAGRLFGQLVFDSTRPQEGLERIRRLRGQAPDLFRGVVTAFPVFGQDPRQREFGPLYEFCAHDGLPIQFLTEAGPGREPCPPLALGVLAQIYPHLKVVGLLIDGGWSAELPRLLRRLPNLFMAVTCSPPRPMPTGGSAAFLGLLRAAGIQRLMFASYRAWRDAAYSPRVEAARQLPWRQRRNLLWRTALQVYGPRLLARGPIEDNRTHSFAR